METINYVVDDISGDYANLKRTDNGDTILVAMALLPFGIDIGNHLTYENFEYTIDY